MRVLLTGGAGFIGSAVARALHGHEVTVLDKLTYAGKRENLDGVDVELVVGDVCDGPLVSRLMQGQDVVIHAAAESHVTNSLDDAAPFLRTNIDGTRNMLEASARARVPHFIHVSTDEVFGSAPPGVAYGLNDTLRPGNFYAASKAAAEAMVHAVAHTRGYAATIVRCTNNYGPRQHVEKAIPTWIHAALSGQPLPIHGDGRAIRDWLFVDDFARGLVMLMEQPPGGVHHFTGGSPLTNSQVARRVATELGGVLLHVDERPGQDARYDLDDARTRRDLGWAPTVPFAEGLNRTIAHYRKAWSDPRHHAG